MERLGAELPLPLCHNTDTITLLRRPGKQNGPGLVLERRDKERSPFTFERLPGYGATRAPVHGRCSPSPRPPSCQPSFIQEKATFEVNKTQIYERKIYSYSENIGAHENICTFSCQQLDTFIFQDGIVMGSKRLGSAGSLYYSSAALRGYLYRLLRSVRPHAPMAASVYNSTDISRARRRFGALENKSCITLNKKEYFIRFVAMCELFTCDGSFLQHWESDVGQQRRPEAGRLYCRATAVRRKVSLK